MIMLSLRLTKKVPFREVYCHSLGKIIDSIDDHDLTMNIVRDSEGRKMRYSDWNAARIKRRC